MMNGLGLGSKVLVAISHMGSVCIVPSVVELFVQQRGDAWQFFAF